MFWKRGFEYYKRVKSFLLLKYVYDLCYDIRVRYTRSRDTRVSRSVPKAVRTQYNGAYTIVHCD